MPTQEAGAVLFNGLEHFLSVICENAGMVIPAFSQITDNKEIADSTVAG